MGLGVLGSRHVSACAPNPSALPSSGPNATRTRVREQLGADFTVDYKQNNIGAAVKELVPEGVDLIFDCASGDTLQQSLSALKPKGKLVSILHQGEGLDPAIDFQYLFL